MTRVTCDRCKRSAKAEKAAAAMWNVTIKDGQAVGYLCPRCQTPEEHLEAAVNEVEDFAPRDGGPVAVLPDGAMATRIMPLGNVIALAQDDNAVVTYVCRRDALECGGLLARSDVLPAGFPGGHPTSWHESQFQLAVQWAAIADEYGWDVLMSDVLDIVQREP